METLHSSLIAMNAGWDIPRLGLRDQDGRFLLQCPAFRLHKGEVLAVTGPSGSGKTLFLKGLFGWAAPGMSARLRTNEGAFLMIQDPSAGLTPGLSIGHHFRDVMSGGGWRTRAEEELGHLGLSGHGLLTRKPATFSGGERQRIMLALILVSNPRLLVCDEPAASLDSGSERALWEHLMSLRSQTELSLVFVTHQPALIEEFADRVMIIEKGQRNFLGPKTDFFSGSAGDYAQNIVTAYRNPPTTDSPDMPQQDEPPRLLLEAFAPMLGTKPMFPPVSRQLGAGRWCWLLGPSGSGKSSLARAIAGLSSRVQGAVFLDGSRLAATLDRREPARRRAIQYLFQHGSQALNPALPVSAQLRRAYAQDARRLAVHLKKLDLVVQKNKLVSAFSLGEIQRLNLVRALATQPRVLICDEILAALDLISREKMVKFLSRYCLETGLAVIMITHDEQLVCLHPGGVLRLP